MIICTIKTSDCTPQTIVIGRRATYDTLQVAFDLSYLVESYGNGVAVLAVKRSQDESAYPAVVTQEDNTLTWTISETDTYYVGAGECQLMWYVDGGLAKTIIYPMVVMRDILSTSEEAPDAYQTWVDDLTALGAETLQNAQDAAQSASDAESAKDDAVTAKEAAEEAAEKAEEASIHAPIIQGGYWYIWNNGQYVDTGVRAEGQKGDQGDPGEKGDTGNGIANIAKTGTSGLVDTYTVTYTDGTTTTFTVTNGAKGDKGDTGATGNGIQSITKTGTSGNVDTYTITYTNGQTTTFTVTNGAVSSVAGKTGAVTLDANDVAFSESGTYDDGTLGAEVSAQKNAIDEIDDILYITGTISYPDGQHSTLPADRRAIWSDKVPAGAIITDVSIPIGNVGSDGYLVLEIWELEADGVTLTKAYTQTITQFQSNSTLTITVNQSSAKERFVGYYLYNVNTFYRTGQTGDTWYYIKDVTDISTLPLSSLTLYQDMSLVGGFAYKKQPNLDFYSGWQSGNVVVFGDSTVDGASTTDHVANTIGTDRTAATEPYVFTSIVETMLNTFTGGNTRVYNAGFGGQTLNYIANNYTEIMSAFDNVKSALLVIDINSASASRETYEANIRRGLTRMINLLRADNIAIAIASPQPMFYYPTDNTGLPALNSAGEFALAVNIGKDICKQYDLPFINLGNVTNEVMASPYLKTSDFYGDRIHFGDGGHKFEGYELYGQLIHPIVYCEDQTVFVDLDSNMGELAAVSGISASNNIGRYRSIVLQADHTRDDVLHRIYVIAKAPVKISGIVISGWTSNYDVYVDGNLYMSATEQQETYVGSDIIQAGCHVITVKPKAGVIVRYSGLVFSGTVSQLSNAIDQKQDATTYVTLSGTIVTQTGADNTMYLCGELAELTFTAPQTGITAVRFTSGTTPTVATFSGVTWLNGFDPSALEASKTYEINILNGLGCAAWT